MGSMADGITFNQLAGEFAWVQSSTYKIDKLCGLINALRVWLTLNYSTTYSYPSIIGIPESPYTACCTVD